jgi:hypothetical protein
MRLISIARQRAVIICKKTVAGDQKSPLDRVVAFHPKRKSAIMMGHVGFFGERRMLGGSASSGLPPA